jgi:hypothetical protein
MAYMEPEPHPNPHIRGIMLPSGDVLFSEDGAAECPWCQLVDMQGCFMHLTCGNTAVKPGRVGSKLAERTDTSVKSDTEHHR